MNKGLKALRRSLTEGGAIAALAVLGFGGAWMATPAVAQDYTQVAATGTIQSTSGQPIAGATVTITSNNQGFTRTATTNADGTYRVPALPPGSYTFTITAPGFGSFTDNAVLLSQAGAANQFTLAAADAGEGGEIVVRAGRLQIADLDRNTVGAVIPIGELATRVPVNRDLTSIVLLAPGTAAGDPSFGSLPAVAGSSVSENAYYVNGLNITDFRQGLGAGTIPFEFYDTVEVKIGSIPAEYGRFTGAFVNATTKSGGNEFHGNVLFNWQPNDLRSTSPNTLYRRNRDYVEDTKQAMFSLSGPIIKDHLFFYGLYQSNDYSWARTELTAINNRPNTAPYSLGESRVYSHNQSPFFGGKLDAIITAGHRLEFTYINTMASRFTDTFNVVDEKGGAFDSRTSQNIVVGGFRGAAAFKTGSENYIGRYTGQFASWLTLSAAYGKARIRDVRGSGDDSLPFVSDLSGQFSPALIGNPVGSIAENNDTRTFYRADVDVYFSLLGQHHIRGGYDREELQSFQSNVRTGGANYTYLYSGSSGDAYVSQPNVLYYSKTTYKNGGLFNSLNEAAYVEDSWSALDNRVNVQAGVRWDRFKNDNVVGVKYFDSKNQFAPRISASFDPVGDRRTKVYGFYGRYFLPVPTNTNIRLAGAETFQLEYFRTSGPGANNVPIQGAPLTGFATATKCVTTQLSNCEINADGTATDTTATVAKNLKPQSVDEFVLGYEQRLGDRWKIGAFGVYRKLNDSLEDAAVDAAVLNYCTKEGIAGCGSIWTGFHQYVLINPGAASQITLSDRVNGESTLRTVNFTAAQLGYPRAKRQYKAVTLTASRDFDGVWSFQGSYTYAKNIGNIEGGVRSDNGQRDSGLTTAFDQPGLTVGTYGYLPTDVRHNIKAFGSYQVAPWLTLGAQLQVQSPRSYGCIGRVPRVVDAFAGQYGAAGYFCNVVAGKVVTNPGFATINDSPTRAGGARPTTLIETRRGTIFKSDWESFLNLSAVFKLPTETFSGTLRFDVFNVFNQQSVIERQENGTQGSGLPRSDYQAAITYQAPRYARIQLGIDF